MYEIVVSRKALNDFAKLTEAGLNIKTKSLIDLMKEDPFQNPPTYEKLVGNMQGLYSRRINYKHRLVYMVYEDIKTIKIISMWSHYGSIK